MQQVTKFGQLKISFFSITEEMLPLHIFGIPAPKLVQEAARKGDKLSQAQWVKTGNILGMALAGLVNILNPERIILGGGMAQAASPIFEPVKAAIKKKAFPIATRFVKVLPATLGTDAGLIGAAALAFSSK